MRLPLTLAIIDGMSVGVGDEIYILPLDSVVESLQVEPGTRATPSAAAARVVEVRGEYLPVVELEQVFSRAARTEPRRARHGRVRPRAAASRCWSTSWSASSRSW